jgi:hypothetical protein
MKRLLMSLALAVSLLAASPLWGQTGVDHLEFVRALRDKYPDLALEYLERLSKMPGLPKEVMEAIPLELARTQLDVAAKDPDAARRARVYDDAAAKMETFLKGNANSPDAPVANLDLARIYAFKSKAVMDKAKQAETKQARQAQMLVARKGFDEAYKKLEKAYDGINAQLVKNKSEKLTQAKLDAEYEMASALLNQLLTYDPEGESQERATIGVKAITEIQRVANRGDRIGSLGLAMLIKCYDELDSFDKAAEAVKELEKKGSEPGRRIGKANYINMHARRDLTKKDIVPLCQEWIKAYRAFADRPEGISVRYQLAQAARVQAKAVRDQKSPDATELYGLAEKYYDEIEHTDSEFADRARIHKIEILILRKPELTKGDLTKLTTFKELVLRAQIEASQLTEESRKGKVDPQHVPNIIQALTLALEKVDDSVTTQELIDARFMLMYYLQVAGDHYRAIVHGEDLARSYPNSTRAGLAGAYTLSAYAQLIDEGEKADPSSQIVATDRARMKSLAEYVDSNWKNDLAGDEARFQLGVMALRQKNYPEAVLALTRVSSGYTMYPLVLFQIGSAAQLIVEAEKKDDKDKVPPPQGWKSWAEVAINAYEKIPAPTNMDAETNRYYFMAKVRLAFMLLAEKKLNEMDKVSTELMARFAKLPAALRKEFEPMVSPLAIYATYGKADVAFKSNSPTKYADVMKTLAPLIKLIADKKLPEGIEPQLPKVVLFLYLKACLLDGKIDDARTALEMIQGGGGFENQGQVLASLVKDISDHIKELAKQGAPKKEEHDKAVANYAAFLDALAKQDLGKIKPELLRFLSQSYSSLNRHDQAALLLSKVQEPPPGSKAEDYKAYRFTRLMLAHEYRLAKNYAEADKVLKELEKTDFATSSLEFREEQCFLLEDMEKWAPAANSWGRMYEDLKRARGKNPRLAEPCERALYHRILCVYRFSQKQTNEKKKADFLKRAANMIHQLELGDKNMGGLKDQYMELMKNEPPLHEAYKALKKDMGAALPPAPAAGNTLVAKVEVEQQLVGHFTGTQVFSAVAAGMILLASIWLALQVRHRMRAE